MVALLLVAVDAGAADRDGRYATRGLGTMSCGTFVRAWATPGEQRDRIAAWVQGYLTAHNRITPGVFDGSPILATEHYIAYLVNICTRAVVSSLEQAAALFVEAMRPVRLSEPAEILTIVTAAGRAFVYASTLRAVQEALRARGALDEPADGDFTVETSEALRRFQRDQGMQETGLPDPDTLLRLLLAGE